MNTWSVEAGIYRVQAVIALGVQRVWDAAVVLERVTRPPPPKQLPSDS